MLSSVVDTLKSEWHFKEILWHFKEISAFHCGILRKFCGILRKFLVPKCPKKQGLIFPNNINNTV